MTCNDPNHAPFWILNCGMHTCSRCEDPQEEQSKEEDQPISSSPIIPIDQDALPQIELDSSPSQPEHDSSPSLPEHDSSSSPTPPPSPPATPDDLKLHGAYILLTKYFKKQEGHFVFRTCRTTLLSVSFILDTFSSQKTSRSSFHSAYTSTNPAESWVPRAVVTAYVSVFENLANTLSPSFRDRIRDELRARFPHMWSWMSDCANLGQAASSDKREWRNTCAHRAFIEKPFEQHSTNAMRARPFAASVFFDRLEEWMPPLREELEDLVAILSRDVDEFEVEEEYIVVDGADVEESIETQRQIEERAKQLIEEGGENGKEIKELQDEEDAARKFSMRLHDVFVKVEREFEGEVTQLKDEKFRRVNEIWKESEPANATLDPGWEGINDRGWKPAEADTDGAVGDELSPNPDSGNDRTEEETETEIETTLSRSSEPASLQDAS